MGSNFPFGAGCFYSALLLIGSNYFELNPYVILLIIWLPILFFYIMYFLELRVSDPLITIMGLNNF